MALFGAPIAHEDRAQRACYAACWLQESWGATGVYRQGRRPGKNRGIAKLTALG